MKFIGFLHRSVFISFKFLKKPLFIFVFFDRNPSQLKMTNLGFPSSGVPEPLMSIVPVFNYNDSSIYCGLF